MRNQHKKRIMSLLQLAENNDVCSIPVIFDAIFNIYDLNKMIEFIRIKCNIQLQWNGIIENKSTKEIDINLDISLSNISRKLSLADDPKISSLNLLCLA